MASLSQPRLRLAVLAVSTILLGTAATASASAPAVTSAPPAGDRPAGGRPYIETSLFFGTAHPDGSPPVTDKQFQGFVDEFVTPRFPDGLTVQEGEGQYRDAHGTIERERSYELILFYPTGQAGPSGRKIEEIRSAYEKKFAQESVARVDDRTTVDF
ncbi:DUF3574 domain-containing protein [Streptomyces sp. NPDC053560]|uniref:DUF3574 domain-containing protein n=1 Tax=Streptomyces sp. NPDC053560 TaxID=3365711 RepID=UPI0037D94A47